MGTFCRLFSITIVLTILGLWLTGCTMQPTLSPEGSSAGQGAVYVHEHTSPDGTSCKSSATTARDTGKATLIIGADCSLTVEVEALDSNEAAAEGFKALNGLIDRLPGGPQ